MLNAGCLPLHHILRPSSRYRLFQMLAPLAELGVQAEVLAAPERDPLKRLAYLPRLLCLARRKDVLFIQKRTFPLWVLELLQRANPRLVFDFDDAIYLQPGNRPRTEAVLRAAQAVVAGNEHLAAFARRHNPNVVVIPTVVDTRQVVPPGGPRHPREERTLLGWIGSDPNRGDLEPLQPVFERLAERYGPALALRTIGRRPLEMRTNLTLQHVRWDLQQSDRDLQAFDIGLMPLADTEWNRGKCAFKLVQYMAVGAASLASPVGANLQVMRDGETGLLASSPAEWQAGLEQLIENPDQRQEMGRRGRERVEAHYSLAQAVPELYRVLAETAAGKRTE